MPIEENYMTLRSVMASSFGVSDQFNLIFYCADGDKTGKIDVVPYDCVDY